MQKLTELKTTLSNEWKKHKSNRDYDLIRKTEEQIEQQKTALQMEFKKRRQEKHDAEVKLKLSLSSKLSDRYGKIRDAKKKEKLDHEKKQREKLQKKKKVK